MRSPWNICLESTRNPTIEFENEITLQGIYLEIVFEDITLWHSMAIALLAPFFTAPLRFWLQA